ncbi:carbohydrate ABC transporter substrate-binding protein (CUT1 family) [Melghirimyces profundicolus]|uniref:Maltodextrin-binding protein n=1 Tax=Melghirimyces profundicolus TaxID=1242148 RepID=A0A2T6C9M3_9BACL|nr:extracellular solute-binding protein [Melghirimyces profundicolus]PTX65000.1 carbohydrate ABC transporter substrate-binding protein (CUT1 family) [Melghirimyces profundicolus]
MKWNKWLPMAMVLVLAVGVLAACGPQRDADQTQKEAGKEEKPKELVIWANKDSDELASTKKLAKRYQEKSGIKVKVVGQDMLKMQDKLNLDGPAGKGPDLVTWPHDRIGEAVITGLIQPIEVSQDVVDQYSESSIKALTYKGKLYGLPKVTESIALYYNKDLIKEPPKTWEELVEYAKENTEPSQKKYGLLFEGENFYYDYFLFRAYGGYIFKEENGKFNTQKVGLNNEGSKKAGIEIEELYKNKLIPKGIKADTVNGLFKEGKVAMVINGPWALSDYRGAKVNFGVAPLPKINGENAQAFIGVKGWYLSNFSKHKEAATELIQFMTSKESLKSRYQDTGDIPPHKDLIEDPVIKEDPAVKAFAEQAGYGNPMPNIPEMGQVWEPINNALAFIAQGKQKPEKALDDAVKLIEEKIKAQKQ